MPGSIEASEAKYRYSAALALDIALAGVLNQLRCACRGAFFCDPNWVQFFIKESINQRLPPQPQKGALVNKAELIEIIATEADLSKAAAGRALDAAVAGITKALKKGDSVSLIGFGTFAVGKRAARNGRNPQTGDTIKIKAAKVPKFRPGKGLKDTINGVKKK